LLQHHTAWFQSFQEPGAMGSHAMIIVNRSIIQQPKKTKWKRMKEIAAKKEIVTIKIRGLF
jgi:hypothetical protein